jgi:RsiW-degrading membrane proteinase PrsW (M82 family)
MAEVRVASFGRWSWLRILIGGSLLFFILERALMATGNPNYIPSLLLVGTFTVPLAFCVFLYTRAREPDVPVLTIGWCLIWGGVLGTVLAGYAEYHAVLRLGALPTVTIGVSEELAKLVVPAYLLLRRKYVSELDGIMLGAAAGAGFAALESMGYGLVALLLSRGDVTATAQILLFRSLAAPAAHIAWSGLLGGALWHARYSQDPRRGRFFIYSFIGAVLLHALWDSAGFVWQYVVIGLLSLIWFVRRVRHAEHETGAAVRPVF